jgi:hypothetical protein
VSRLGQVLTPDNLDDLVARAAFKTKAEVDTIAASVKPRSAPADGIRRLPATAPAVHVAGDPPLRSAQAPESSLQTDLASARGPTPMAPPQEPNRDERAPATIPPPEPLPPRPPEVRAISGDHWSLRVTLDTEAKADLETLTMLLAHKNPTGDLAAVLKEALRCGVEKHGKRRGAVQPTSKRVGKTRSDEPSTVTAAAIGLAAAAPSAATAPAAAPATAGAPATRLVPAAPTSSNGIPAEVRRRVWERDGGRCTFTSPDGTRCGSRWKLEFDHIIPKAVGGQSTVDGLRLRCRAHNLFHAEEAFGREHMDLFRRSAGAQVM